MAGCISKQRMNSNNSNKQKFVLMLDESMDERRIQTHLAKGDADAMIVLIAVDSATKHVTTVIEYTTLLVLLHLHADPNSFDLIFRSERRNMVRVCNMQWLQNALVPQICNLLPFAHAILLDATSSHTYFGIGKGVAPKVE